MSQYERSRGEERLLEQLLQHLEGHSDDERIRELASGVLAGQLPLEGALSTEVGFDAFRSGITAFCDWRRELDDAAVTEELRHHHDQVERLSEGG